MTTIFPADIVDIQLKLITSDQVVNKSNSQSLQSRDDFLNGHNRRFYNKVQTAGYT